MLALGKSVLKAVSYVSLYAINPYRYILKCKRNAIVFNPLFLPRGSHEANFLIVSCVPAH